MRPMETSLVFIFGGIFMLLASMLFLDVSASVTKPIVATAAFEDLEGNLRGLSNTSECARGFVVKGNGLKPYGINDGDVLKADEVTNHATLVSNPPDFAIIGGPDHPFEGGCTVAHVAHVYRTGLSAKEFTEETRNVVIECRTDNSGLYMRYKRDCVFADYEPFPFVLLVDVCGHVSFIHPTRVYARVTEIINKNNNIYANEQK